MILCKKNTTEFADIHCHIIPQVDDGAADMQEALLMLQTAYKSGIRHMIVTPHYKEGTHNASPAVIREKMLALQSEAADNGIFISLYPGNEIFYFSDIENGLNMGLVQSLNGTKHLLVEFLPSENFTYIRNAVNRLIGIGYIPVIAHVERYECMRKHIGHIEQLRMLGGEIQVNVASVEGRLGLTVKHFTHQLLKQQLVDYLGTDAHDDKKRSPDVKRCMKRLYQKYDRDYIDRISYLNVMQLIEDAQYD